ncbi:MAG: recombinase family protein [Gammaproteobacteria bacterium]|nr:recombinase family protein [Pseudomonadales bacterium]MCP5346094.1 recombinase family protein [Pseudomonadales bacterium]
MTIYSYCRFTELEKGDEHQTLESLIEREMLKIRTYCLRQQWFVTEIIRDLDTAWNEDFAEREASGKLMAMLQEGDIVVSSSLERIFSSCHDAVTTIATLKERGVQLHLAPLGGDVTNPEFMVNFERVGRLFSSLEKRRSAERIKRVKHKQRSKGRYLGGSRPFGYMIHENGRLIENPMEQRVLKRILQLKKDGKSLRAISKEVSTPLVPVSFKTVQRLLQRHGY